nr:putative reverse transcriptase domain-containing protein [Tanacetum cinerariifolium]
MESVQDMSGCKDSQKVKHTTGLFVGMVAATELKTIQKAMQIAGTLNDEALRNGSIKKNLEKRGNRGESSKDRNVRDDNKRNRTRNAFATTINPIRRGYIVSKARGNPQNQVLAVNGGQGHRNQGNQVRGRALMLGAEEASQDPNIVTSTFTLNDHYATTLFDSGADYIFVSTTFIPMLDIEPNDLGFSYEIEIANEQLVEIDKVIQGCKLEIKDHVFEINLIPFGIRSFDVIIGMDWLSDHKAEIICHEKVVRIPLFGGEVIRVLGEKLKEKVKQLMSVKAKEKKQEEVIVVKEFPKVNSGNSKTKFHLTKLIALGSIDPSKIEAVKNWKAHRTSFGVRSFLELVRYYRSKASVVADALSRKERVKPKRVKAMNMTLQLSIKDSILSAQKEASDESGKLASRFVRPFEIIEKVGPMAYRLDFPEELNGVHGTFHVSNLKKCLADPTLQVPLDEIRVDAKLNLMEEPMEILEREFKKLKRSRIAIVKVWWNLKREPEFT